MSTDREANPLLAALWGESKPDARDRRPVLTATAVVSEAVSIAQTDGAQAVSMSRIAKRLGFSPMALYRHVTNKEEMLALMVEWALEAVPPPVLDDQAWRRSLTTWAWGMHGLFREHRWLAEFNLIQIPFGPRRLAWFECGMAALSETELSDREKVGVVQLINGFVFADAQAAPDPTVSEDDEAGAFSALLEHIGDETYPAVLAAVAAGAFTVTAEGTDAFEFGLELILDGVGALVVLRAR